MFGGDGSFLDRIVIDIESIFPEEWEVLYANIPDETRTCIIENSLKLWKNKRNFGTSEDIVHDLEKKCATGWEHVQVLYKTMKADFYKLTKPMQDMIIEIWEMLVTGHFQNTHTVVKEYYSKWNELSETDLDILVKIFPKLKIFLELPYATTLASDLEQYGKEELKGLTGLLKILQHFEGNLEKQQSSIFSVKLTSRFGLAMHTDILVVVKVTGKTAAEGMLTKMEHKMVGASSPVPSFIKKIFHFGTGEQKTCPSKCFPSYTISSDERNCTSSRNGWQPPLPPKAVPLPEQFRPVGLFNGVLGLGTTIYPPLLGVLPGLLRVDSDRLVDNQQQQENSKMHTRRKHSHLTHKLAFVHQQMVMLLLHYRTSLTLQFVFLLAALAQVGNSMGPVDDTLPSGSNPAPPAPAPLSAPPTPAAAPPPSMPSFFQGLEEANPFLKIDFKDHHWGGMQFTHQEQQQPQFSSTNWKSQVVEGEKDVKNFFENVLPYPASHQSTEYLIESSTWLTTSTDDGGNVEVDIQQAGYQEEAGETETLENAGHLEMDIQQGEQQQAKEESETLYSQSSGGGFGS
uniref:Uncharacterized protein n=1 Tax=Ditylenchus dipsaci TaxID=166011 RepID=A0A915ECT2_9BILA